MPNNRNARKAMRQNAKARLRNRTVRSTLKTLVKKVRETAGTGDATAADSAYRLAAQRLDQAASKHVIHKNKAARLKSRLSKLAKGKAAATPAS